ncbi:MAG: 2TM domain-containing protein [Alphaproteobacteria bacterium]|nr:2TM domain-containing protein [Alphaproteobacteria bacterium]
MTDLGPNNDTGPDNTPCAAETRLKGFIRHLGAYFVVMAVLVAVNFLTSETPWFLLPLVGWGAVLSLHAAYAMGLFGALGKNGHDGRD